MGTAVELAMELVPVSILEVACNTSTDDCLQRPSLCYNSCEEKRKSSNCYEIVRKGVAIHCAKYEKSPACSWITTTTKKTTSTTTTTTTTTTVPSTTVGSNLTPIIIGCVIGGVAMLAVMTIILVLCRKKATKAPGSDEASGMAKTMGKNKKSKKNMTSTTKTTGTRTRTKSGTKSGTKTRTRQSVSKV